jgi:hypothetical protein
MRLNLATILMLRRAALAFVAALEAAALELGWTPRGSSRGVASRDILDGG